jgi:hypothetical protein
MAVAQAAASVCLASLQAARQAAPALCLGQACLQCRELALIAFLQSFGHLAMAGAWTRQSIANATPTARVGFTIVFLPARESSSRRTFVIHSSRRMARRASTPALV